jgi:hypothetical protein
MKHYINMNKMKQGILIVDLGNLKASCNEKYAKNPDLFEIKNFITNRLKEIQTKRSIGYYVCPANFNPEKYNGFIEDAGWLGMEVKLFDKDKENNSSILTKNIFYDVIENLHFFDSFIFVTGNSKFMPIIEILHQFQKEVIIISFQHSCSFALKKTATKYLYIDSIEDNEITNSKNYHHNRREPYVCLPNL